MTQKYKTGLMLALAVSAALLPDYLSAQTCTPRSIPYLETFNSVTAPAIPACTETVDLDGDGKAWKTQNTGVDKNNLRFRNENGSINEGWFYTEGLELEKDTVYTFRCIWGAGGRNATPLLRIHWGAEKNKDSMQANPVLLDNNSTAHAGFDTLEADFTPSRSGVYYIGFYGYGNDALTVGIDISIDDIIVVKKGSVLIDASLTTISDIAGKTEICADTNADLKVVVTNTGILPVTNILVDLAYSGGSIGARSGTIAGPILMGESDTLSFSSVDLSATGNYQFISSIYSDNDELAANDSLDISLSVVTNPSADSIIVTESTNGEFTFEAANPASATTYGWDFGDGQNSNSSNPSHTYDQAGTYTVTMVISNACGSDTLTTSVEAKEGSSGIRSLTGAGWTIYPNPAQDQVVILNNSNVPVQNIAVFNSLGSMVFYSESTESRMQIRTDGWANGLYLMHIQTEREQIVRKLEIIH